MYFERETDGCVERVAASPLSLQQLSSVPKLGYPSHQDNRFWLTRPPPLLRKEFENAVESSPGSHPILPQPFPLEEFQ